MNGMIPEPRERKIILLLCLLAAVHAFIFSAAFPFFNNVDEQLHFDLAVKYSQGHVPRSLEKISPETAPYLSIFGTHEYLWPSNNFPAAKFPPPWTQKIEKVAPALAARQAAWRNVVNDESSQPPLYYTLAGIWWQLGKAFGFRDGFLLYWLRFLNCFFVGALVWLGSIAARTAFPENLFLKIGVPALLALIPQTAFYSIQNDALSPVCFGAAFILLVRFFSAEIPNPRVGIATGIALAATFLTKISNLPLLGVSAIFIALKIWRLSKEKKSRAAIPAIFTLVLCALLPMAAWLAWCKYNFGDFTGASAKIQFLGWTYKPFSGWFQHPIFTPHGFWIFIRDLVATFWQGEILWHRKPLALPAVDLIYVLLTFFLVSIALANFFPKLKFATKIQSETLWFALACFVSSIVFFGFLSIVYDFHDCFYPSRAHPYFTSGRLMLGALIPFMLLFVFGLDCILKIFCDRIKFFVLTILILFMLVLEITTDWRIFPNPYNWFHL